MDLSAHAHQVHAGSVSVLNTRLPGAERTWTAHRGAHLREASRGSVPQHNHTTPVQHRNTELSKPTDETFHPINKRQNCA